MFSIHSIVSDRELIFTDRIDGHFCVTLNDATLSCTTKVWEPVHSQSLNDFFQELAAFRNPWQSEKVWVSDEAEMEISATCTTLGHVIFQLHLLGPRYEPEEWQIQADLEIGLGQLDQIVKDATIFFRTN